MRKTALYMTKNDNIRAYFEVMSPLTQRSINSDRETVVSKCWL